MQTNKTPVTLHIGQLKKQQRFYPKRPALKLDASQSAVSRYEAAERSPDFDMLVAVLPWGGKR